MLKKILLSTLLFIGSAAGNLSAGFLSDDIQFYVGAVGGVSALSGEYHALNPIIDDRHTATPGVTSGIAGGVLGVQVEFCQDIFVGLQANALYNSLSKTIRSSTDSFAVPSHVVHLKNNFEYGVDARIGMNICNAMPYVLAGIEAGKFKMTLSNDTLVPLRGIPPGGAEVSKTLWGPKVGVGVTFPIACNIYLNLEYSYTWFKNVKTTLIDSVTQIAWDHKVRVNQNMFLVGLNYMF